MFGILSRFALNSDFAVSSAGRLVSALPAAWIALSASSKKPPQLVIGNDGIIVRIEQPVKDAEPIFGRLYRLDESLGIDDVEAAIAAEPLDIRRYKLTQPTGPNSGSSASRNRCGGSISF